MFFICLLQPDAGYELTYFLKRRLIAAFYSFNGVIQLHELCNNEWWDISERCTVKNAG
jgi:hypothetical protein